MPRNKLLSLALLFTLPQSPDPRVELQLHGWLVSAAPALISGPHAADGARAISMLGNHLERISILLPDAVLSDLQSARIWLDWDNPDIRGMQYHPSLGWLERGGHDPGLHKAVHIPQAMELLSRAQMLKHPAVILHELAHAYHDQVLGFDRPDVIEAYRAAASAGTYDRVLSHRGDRVRHYGLTNHKEYFAEATEAYFYRNDFYPFVAAELLEADPAGFKLMQRIWGPLR